MPSFLLEVGTEELPASFVDAALSQWRSRIPAQLTDWNLPAKSIHFYGTPRRLAVLIQGLPSQQPDQAEEVKGPPAQAAFKDGQPTKAAIGFAQKQGVAIETLEIRSTEKGDFVFINKVIQGRPIAQILVELVPQWIQQLDGKRFMRWSDGDLKFSRPIRWLVALLDEAVLPIAIATHTPTEDSALPITASVQAVQTDRYSRGHRVLHPEPIVIRHADTYVADLKAGFVEVDPEQRQALIHQQIAAAAADINGQAIVSPNLLQEVTQLVEYPSAVVGQFDADFLELPPEVITTEMESHQRYFPVQKIGSTELLPYFITISNGDPAKAKIIAAGNERVIRARLSDGKFFFDADRKRSLEDYLPKLETVTFQADLGSVRAKVERIVAIAQKICDQLQIPDRARQPIQQAARLCKADLVTQMVGEFPELQGVMGQKYALHSGAPIEVATAIYEHYLPRGAGDVLPETLAGQVVGLSDRLDTLVSIFGLGLIPSGSSDPFALRRAATAIVNIIWQGRLNLNLSELLEQIVAGFATDYAQVMKLSVAELNQHLKAFLLQRVATLMKDDRGIDYDLVNAVLTDLDVDYADRVLADLLDGRDRIEFLQTIRQDGRLAKIYETINRASRLAAQGTLDTQQRDPALVVQPQRFQKNSERDFYQALVDLQQSFQPVKGQGTGTGANYPDLIAALTEIVPTVSRFFDGEDSVLVMDRDLEIQRNRLNLLGILRNYGLLLADFGAIVKGEGSVG